MLFATTFMSGIKSPDLQPAQTQQILSEIQKRLQLNLQSPTRLMPGQPLIASVVPTVPQIDVSELVNGFINLAWLEKDVLFKDVNAVPIPPLDTTDAKALNGDRIITGLEQDPSNVIKQPFPVPVSTSSLPQTAGVAAQLAGALTLPRLSVSIKTEWIVEKDGVQQSDGKDLVAINGLTNVSLSILLPPIIRELRADTVTNPGGQIFCISAKVTLSIGKEELVTTLGPVPVLQLPILIPTIVALFSEPNFSVTDESAVVIWVPKHSVFSSAAPLFKVLRKIEAVLDSLQSIAGIAGFLLSLKEVTDLLDHPRLRFVAADEITNLGEILLKRKPWYDLLGDDRTFDDKTSSLFVFGLPATEVLFYNYTKFKKEGGYYQVTLNDSINVGTPPNQYKTLPDYFVAIRAFPTTTDREVHPELNSAVPETFPPDRITDSYDDPNSANVWEDRLGSVKFGETWLNNLKKEVASPVIFNELKCPQTRRHPSDRGLHR